MISKILLTLFVIVIAWLVVTNRQRRMAAIASQPRVATPVQKGLNWRWGVYLFVILMILGSGLLLYMKWQDGYQVVTVQVIDTQTGRSVVYKARRMDVDERRFMTLDGTEVSVADTERIEVENSRDNRR
jgi:hypothetical protein